MVTDVARLATRIDNLEYLTVEPTRLSRVTSDEIVAAPGRGA